MNASSDDRPEVPAGPTTRTSTVPAPTGATAVMVVGEVTVKSDEALGPNSTALAPLKPVPEISIVAPPPAVPLEGVRDETDTAELPPPLGPAATPELGRGADVVVVVVGRLVVGALVVGTVVAGVVGAAATATDPIAGEP